MKKMFVYVLLLFILNGCMTSLNNRAHFISEEDARNIAETKIIELGWEINIEMDVNVYWSITPWNKHHPDFKDFYSASSYYSGFDKKLEDRKYWSVEYRPKDRSVKGGTFCFFIDAETGEIIDIYKGY